MPDDESLLQLLASDPDHQSNGYLASAILDLEEKLRSLSTNAEKVERTIGFFSFVGEMIGNLWHPVLMKRSSRHLLESMLEQVGWHRFLAVNERVGLPFYTHTTAISTGPMQRPPERALPDGPAALLGNYARGVMAEECGEELADEFHLWATRATARYIAVYRAIAEDPYSNLLDELKFASKLCVLYIASVRLAAVAVEASLSMSMREPGLDQE